jgi:hypothetical protein
MRRWFPFFVFTAFMAALLVYYHGATAVLVILGAWIAVSAIALIGRVRLNSRR